MKSINKIEIKNAIQQIEEAKSEIDYTDPKKAIDLAKVLNNEPTSILYGALGVTVGATFGVTVGVIGGVAMVATGGAGALIGGILAIIFWRGKKFQKLEKLTAETEHSLDFLNKQILRAKQNGDKVLVKALQEEYIRKIKRYGNQSDPLIGDDNNQSKTLQDGDGSNVGQEIEFEEVPNK